MKNTLPLFLVSVVTLGAFQVAAGWDDFSDEYMEVSPSPASFMEKLIESCALQGPVVDRSSTSFPMEEFPHFAEGRTTARLPAFSIVDLTDSDDHAMDRSSPIEIVDLSDSDDDTKDEEEMKFPDYLEDPSLSPKEKRVITNKTKNLKGDQKEKKILVLQNAYYRKHNTPGFDSGDIRAKKAAAARKEKLAKMSPEEKAAYNAEKNLCRRQRYANLSAAEKALLREKKAEADRQRYANRSAEEKVQRNAADRQRYAEMPAAEKEAYMARKTEAKRQLHAKLSLEEKAKRNADQRQWLAKMSEEEKTTYRAKQAEAQRQYRAKKKAEKEAAARKQSVNLPPEARAAERVENVLTLQALRARKERVLEGLEG